MGTLVLHVGQAKAASTSLQKALDRLRPELAQHGIAYPSTGRSDHSGEAAWFVSNSGAVEAGALPVVAAHIERLSASADWDSLVRSVDKWPLTIVSSELFSRFGPSLAEAAVNSLTGGRPEDVRVVVIARPMSGLLPSLYAQTALDFALPSFESWVRVQLRGLISPATSTTQRSSADSEWVASTWSHVAPVRVVNFDPPTGLDFENSLLDALMLTTVVTPPVLGRANRGLCAARLIAWQRQLRQAGRPDSPGYLGARVPFLEFDDSSLPGGGGRFRLTDQAAKLIDAAFPRPAMGLQSTAVALREVAQLIVSEEPVTCVSGVDDDGLAVGIEMCLRQLPHWGRGA